MDYISREAAYNAIVNNYDKDDQLRDLCALPAADVREVKRGKWIPYNPLESGNAVHFQCSNCNAFYQMEVPNRTHDFDYCPSCGAYMRGKPINEWLRKYQMPPNCGADMREEQT